MAIPSVIHSIWFQGWDVLPAKYSSNVASVVSMNPGWTYMKWDDKSLSSAISSLGPSYLDKYNSFKLLHQKVDFGRYAVLYLYGGVSVDIDAAALKGFSSLPELSSCSSSDFIVSKNSTSQFINNATILVSARNPLMLSLLDSISSDSSGYLTDTGCVYKTTGPSAFTKFVDAHKDSITIVSNSYFEPCSGRDNYCTPGPSTILDHQHEGSWVHPFFISVSSFCFTLRRYQGLILFLLVLVILVVLFNKSFSS